MWTPQFTGKGLFWAVVLWEFRAEGKPVCMRVLFVIYHCHSLQ